MKFTRRNGRGKDAKQPERWSISFVLSVYQDHLDIVAHWLQHFGVAARIAGAEREALNWALEGGFIPSGRAGPAVRQKDWAGNRSDPQDEQDHAGIAAGRADASGAREFLSLAVQGKGPTAGGNFPAARWKRADFPRRWCANCLRWDTITAATPHRG